MKKNILLCYLFVSVFLIFGCRGTYNIANKHIKGELSTRLPNLAINFDEKSFLYVLGNPRMPCVKIVGQAVSLSSSQSLSKIEFLGSRACIGENGYMPNAINDLLISEIPNYIKQLNKSYGLNNLSKEKFDEKNITFEQDVVKEYENFISSEVKSKFIFQSLDAPVGVIEFKFPTMGNTKFKKGLLFPCIIVPACAFFIPSILGVPVGVEDCHLPLICTIKDNQGNIIKTYSVEGEGHIYSAAWYGYQFKYFTRWYIKSFEYIGKNLILPQRVNAISDALEKISKQIDNDCKYIHAELLKNK